MKNIDWLFCDSRNFYFQSQFFQSEDDVRYLPNYFNVVFSPMFINMLEQKNKQHQFGSTKALISSVRQIFHNSIVFNGGKLLNQIIHLIFICSYKIIFQRILNTPKQLKQSSKYVPKKPVKLNTVPTVISGLTSIKITGLLQCVIRRTFCYGQN